MKRIKPLIRNGILVGSLVTINVQAFANIYGVVVKPQVPIYNVEGEAMDWLEKDENIFVIDENRENNVYQIRAENVEGYIEKENVYIRKVLLEAGEDDIKVRKSPDPNAQIIVTLENGESISVLYTRGNWHEVALSNGEKGYIYKSQLEGRGLELLPEKGDVQVEVISWSEASKMVPRGAVVMIEDVYTGKTFKVKRTFGTNHADVETLTKQDTQIMKQIWGGFTWERRPVIVHVGGRRLAASLAGMPHAGGSLNGLVGNGMSGVIDLHFRGSKKHAEGKITATTDSLHQNAISIAAQYNSY